MAVSNQIPNSLRTHDLILDEAKSQFNLIAMKNFSVYFTDYAGRRVGDKVSIMSRTDKDAAAEFAETNFSKEPFIRVSSFLGWKEFDNPQSAAIKEAEETQRQAEEAQRQADIDSFSTLIETLKKGSPDDLKYLQLETIIENHLLFPKLNVNEGSEIYCLREELYMLSLRHQTLQTVIQTRILSDKLDALQTAITGVANTQVGIAKNQAKRNQSGLIGQAAMLTKLGNIENDVDDVADGFFGED